MVHQESSSVIPFFLTTRGGLLASSVPRLLISVVVPRRMLTPIVQFGAAFPSRLGADKMTNHGDGNDNDVDELAEADDVVHRHAHAVEEGGGETTTTTATTTMTSGGTDDLEVDGSGNDGRGSSTILPRQQQQQQQQQHPLPRSELQSDQHDGACVTGGAAIDTTMSSNENNTASTKSSSSSVSTNNNNEFTFTTTTTTTIRTKLNDCSNNDGRGESSSSLWPEGVSDRLSEIDDDDDNCGDGVDCDDDMAASMERRMNQRRRPSTEDEHEGGNENCDYDDDDGARLAISTHERALTILPSNELSILPTRELSTDVIVPPSSGGATSSREITVLPSNEISTTTADAALAAETFADMMLDDDDNNDGDLYSSSCPLNNNNNAVSHHQPVVDGSGVVHRTHRTLIPGGAAAAAVSSSTAIPGCGGRNDKGGGGGKSDGIDEEEEDLMEFLNNEYGSAIDLHPRISVGGTISGGIGTTENGDIGMGNNKSSSSIADDHLSSCRGVGAGANENINNNNDDTINPTTKRGYHHHLHPRNNNNNSNGMSASEEDDEDDDNDDEEEEEDSSEISASDEDDASWISWFCNLRGNEYFVEVDEDYIQDDFNLTGLNGIVPYYDYALDMILDVEMPMEDRLTEEEHEIVESAAEMLYGMVHARYIVTNRGMHAMYEKYRAAAFGRCPQVYCQGQPVLPVGLSDMPRNYTVNVFCPRCHGLYFPKSTRQANIDGAYFGTTFPHLYLITHPEMIPICPMQQYVPRVYGFRINENSLYFRNHNNNNNNNEDEQQQQQLNNNNSGSGAGALIGGGQNDNTRSGGGISGIRR